MTQPSVTAVESLKEAFQARTAQRVGSLRLASIQGSELHGAIERFRARCPHIPLMLTELRSIDTLKFVEDGQCDLGFALVSADMTHSPLLHYERVGERSFTLMTPPRHALLAKRKLRLADVVRYPIITGPRNNPLRRQIERAFDRAGLLAQFQVGAESDSSVTSEQLVALGLGVALGLPGPTRVTKAAVVYRTVPELFGSVPLYLTWLKGRHFAPHVGEFVALAKELLRRG
jgi:DNA-binding transcriptional LysR family regulator